MFFFQEEKDRRRNFDFDSNIIWYLKAELD